MLAMVMVYFGLSLDSFVVMMSNGARLKDMNAFKKIKDALIFAMIDAAAWALGYLISHFLNPLLHGARFQFFVGSQLLLLNGVALVVFSLFRKHKEERLEKEWGYKKLIRSAALTSLDTLILATGFAMLGLPFIPGLLMAFLTTFAAVLCGLHVGYKYGSQYEKPIGAAGGILMIVFSLWIMHNLVGKFLV